MASRLNPCQRISSSCNSIIACAHGACTSYTGRRKNASTKDTEAAVATEMIFRYPRLGVRLGQEGANEGPLCSCRCDCQNHGGQKLNTYIFPQNYSGNSGIFRQNPGISRQKVCFPWFRGTYRAFGPQPFTHRALFKG